MASTEPAADVAELDAALAEASESVEQRISSYALTIDKIAQALQEDQSGLKRDRLLAEMSMHVLELSRLAQGVAQMMPQMAPTGLIGRILGGGRKPKSKD